MSAMVARNFEWSDYSKDIFEFILNGRGHGVIDAVAGSGKTTTIEHGSTLVRGSAIFVAFNKAIVIELKERVPGVDCQTLNSVGHRMLMSALGRVTLDDSKYGDLVKEATMFWQHDDLRDCRATLNQMVGFAQSTLCETSDAGLEDMCARYGIEIPATDEVPEAWFYQVVRDVLAKGEKIAREDKVISFNDQIWLPNVWNLSGRKYDFVFVDECQDLSKAKLELVFKLVARGGRIIAVGDPRQSIYGFAGADPRAWHELIERTQATKLPLSVCYRCPKSHIELAKEIVPQIEAAASAKDGLVGSMTYEKLFQNVRSGDLVLCRTTAPLIKACLEMIAQRIPARVKGRDLASGLLALAREALGKRGNWADFPELLDAYVNAKCAKFANRKDAESKINALRDRADGLRACYDAFNTNSFAEFERELQALFSDGTAAVELSTVHKAKGLQAKRVFILQPELLGKFGKLDWEKEQEQNLKYVALTRAQEELYFVNGGAK